MINKSISYSMINKVVIFLNKYSLPFAEILRKHSRQKSAHHSESTDNLSTYFDRITLYNSVHHQLLIKLKRKDRMSQLM